MTKCSIVDCTNKPTGGFEKIIEAGNFGDPSAALPGTRIFWCETHQDTLEPKTYGLRGRRLRSNDLA